MLFATIRGVSQRVVDRVVAAFEQWSAELGSLPEAPGPRTEWRDRITVLLKGRHEYLNCPVPTLWRSGDVHRLLVDYVVPRQVDAWQLADCATVTVRDFLEFLDGSGWLHPASTRVVTLLKELERAEQGFREAMADESRFRLAKRVFTAMRADGLRLDDDASVLDRWVGRFNGLDGHGRRRILGDLLDKDPGYAGGQLLVHEGQAAILQPGRSACKCQIWPDVTGCGCGPDEPEPQRPQLSADAELAVSAVDSGVLHRLSALADWVGDAGRSLDKRGELRPKDVAAAAAAVGVPDGGARRIHGVPALVSVWGLALEFDVLALRRDGVVPGGALPELRRMLRGGADPDAVLELWDGVYGELLTGGGSSAEDRKLNDMMQRFTPRLLGMLFYDFPHGQFVEILPVAEEVVAEQTRKAGPEMDELVARFAVFWMLARLVELADHGAVDVDAPAIGEDLPAGAAELARSSGVPQWAVTPPPGLRMRLTGLGVRAIWQRVDPRLAGDDRGGAANVSPVAATLEEPHDEE